MIPPEWAYGPTSDEERIEEEHISPVWGAVLDDGSAEIVYPESARDTAVVYRCRFYTTLTASNSEEFEAAIDGFLSELDDWWTRFTSWVGILTSQDFVGLGGHPGGMTRSYPSSPGQVTQADGGPVCTGDGISHPIKAFQCPIWSRATCRLA